MDPALAALLLIIGVVSAPTIIKNVVARTIVFTDEKVKDVKFKKVVNDSYKNRNGAPEKLIKEKVDLNHGLKFSNIKTGQSENMNVREDISFNIDEDVLLKGRLHTIGEDGTRKVQDIYLFQPRLFCGDVLLGPKLADNGHMSDKYTYLCRKKDGEILKTYVPKREIFSSIRFDYVSESKHSFLERNPQYENLHKEDRDHAYYLEDFLYLEIPKDLSGDYIPVDLRNKAELEEFQQYVKNFKDNKINPAEYFNNQLRQAEMALNKYLRAHPPQYAKSRIMENPDAQIFKVKESKVPEKKSINEFYKRYDYYLDPVFGEKYNHYDGVFGNRKPPVPQRKK